MVCSTRSYHYSLPDQRRSCHWPSIWKHLSVLNFSLSHFKIYEECDGTEDPTEEFRSFALLVNGVLALLRNPRAIRMTSSVLTQLIRGFVLSLDLISRNSISCSIQRNTSLPSSSLKPSSLRLTSFHSRK